MAHTIPIRLEQSEVYRQARKFFGADGLGLDVVIDEEPARLRFQAEAGFVELEIRPDTNNQVRLTIMNQGFEQAIQQFRRRLARQAAAESSASN
ncbi:MAG: hypothetical protein QJR03_05650 [Sphaerobacter sp.]|nr:hypothetical protein [Sphaerobacter sp.]